MRLFSASHFRQYFEITRCEDIVDRDLAIFAHGVVNISEFATFLPFVASETKVCKRSKTGNFFFGFYKSRKRKLHCHETSSNAIALVKTTGPWCRAFAFADCDPTPTLFKVAS